MALSFTGLERMEEGQRGIEGFFSAGPSKTKTDSNTNTDADADTIPSIPPFTEQSSVTPAPAKRSHPSSPKPERPEHKSEPSAKKTRLPTLHTGKRKTGLESFLVKRVESSSGSTTGSGPSGQPPTPTASTLEAITIGDATGVDHVPAFAFAAAPDPSMEAGPSRHDTPNIHTDDFVDSPTLDPAANGDGDGDGDGDDGAEAHAMGSRWMCPQCNALFAEPDASGRSLSEQKQEHEDYHFALSLQDDGSNGTGRLGRPGWRSMPVLKGQNKVKKKERNKEGIKAFFAPKQGGEAGGVKKESWERDGAIARSTMNENIKRL
jgi:DNA polymerase eta